MKTENIFNKCNKRKFFLYNFNCYYDKADSYHKSNNYTYLLYMYIVVHKIWPLSTIPLHK